MRAKRMGFAAITVAAMLMGVLGCELEGPEGPQGPEGPAGWTLAFIVAELDGARPWETTGNAEVMISNITSFPSVRINDIDIVFEEYAEDALEFDSDLAISAGDSATLVVTWNRSDGSPATATGGIRVPGLFEVTSHDSLAVVHVGNGLTVTWSPSAGADCYSLDFDLSYGYVDTAGVSAAHDCYLDTVVTDTFVTYSETFLFPHAAEIDSIRYSWGEFDIDAVDGPMIDGAVGNITGDGIGFFTGETFGGHLDVDITN